MDAAEDLSPHARGALYSQAAPRLWRHDDAGDVRGVAWVDFDDDGDLDFSLAREGAPGLVWENVADLLFGELVEIEAEIEQGGRAHFWADFDVDGDPDLATATARAQESVYRNEGGALVLAHQGEGSSPVVALAWGDADGDGWLDLAAGREAQGSTRVLRNLGGSLAPASAPDLDSFLEPSTSRALLFVDMTGDGRLDLLESNESTSSRVYINDGGSPSSEDPTPFVDGYGSWYPSSPRPSSALGAGDLDADGDQDLLLGSCCTGTAVLAG
jgi:hypothetical protein